MIEQLPILCILHDQEKGFFSFQDLIQLYNVRMLHYFENVDLTANSFDVCVVSHFVLKQYFHRNLNAFN
jgi:hypothetical protein